jgi:hypothetical protein
LPPKVRRAVFEVMFIGLSAGALTVFWWPLPEAPAQLHQQPRPHHAVAKEA